MKHWIGHIRSTGYVGNRGVGNLRLIGLVGLGPTSNLEHWVGRICVGIRGHMGHIGILVVAVRRLSRRWKVKTLLAGPSPTSPIRRRLPTPLFPTI